MRFLAQMCQTRTFNLYLVDRLRTSNDSAAIPLHSAPFHFPLPHLPPPHPLSLLFPLLGSAARFSRQRKTKKLKTKNKIK